MQTQMNRSQAPRIVVHPAIQLQKPGRSVFIVEDDPEMVALIERVLRGIDPVVEMDWSMSAEDATEQLVSRTRRRGMALKWSEFPYDLIVADIFLHGAKTGVDLWRTCSEMFPKVPVVITSAMPVEKFFKTLGVGSISPPFLEKPFALGECKSLFEAMFEYSDSMRIRR